MYMQAGTDCKQLDITFKTEQQSGGERTQLLNEATILLLTSQIILPGILDQGMMIWFDYFFGMSLLTV